jgi:SAM-dependent methyltransferase
VARERNIGEFNRDASAHDGYLYTADAKLSCRMANGRMTRAILEFGDLEGKRVIDIGCGDGTYSGELMRAGAREVLGVDAAHEAVDLARTRFGGLEGLRFEVLDVYSLEQPTEPYDVAVVRGVLHHLYDVEKAIERICRIARQIIVVEPNGYNPILKIIERVSPYHVAHEEKSYPPYKLDRWFETHGGQIESSDYIGLVPMFCPDLMARVCRWIEPVIERTPLLRRICCAQYVQKVCIS